MTAEEWIQAIRQVIWHPRRPGRLYYSSLQQAEQWSDTAPPPDGVVEEPVLAVTDAMVDYIPAGPEPRPSATICPHCFATRPIDQTECALCGCASQRLSAAAIWHSQHFQAIYPSELPPRDFHTSVGEPNQNAAASDVEDIVRDLQGEHGISWTHAAAFIKLVEGCGCCSERLRMVLDRLFQITTPEEKEDVE